MRNRFLQFIAAAGMLLAPLASAQDTNFAVRIPCEIQTAGPSSLAELTWQQGTTPLIRADVLRMGRPVPADPMTVARLVFGQTRTATNYVAVTNYLATNSSYFIQLPTVGTNSAGTNATAQAWFYTLYFERDGRAYWSGNGSLYIEPTTSTGTNGLVWQAITAGAAQDLEARSTAAAAYSAATNAERVASEASSAAVDTLARSNAAAAHLTASNAQSTALGAYAAVSNLPAIPTNAASTAQLAAHTTNATPHVSAGDRTKWDAGVSTNMSFVIDPSIGQPWLQGVRWTNSWNFRPDGTVKFGMVTITSEVGRTLFDIDGNLDMVGDLRVNGMIPLVESEVTDVIGLICYEIYGTNFFTSYQGNGWTNYVNFESSYMYGTNGTLQFIGTNSYIRLSNTSSRVVSEIRMACTNDTGVMSGEISVYVDGTNTDQLVPPMDGKVYTYDLSTYVWPGSTIEFRNTHLMPPGVESNEAAPWIRCIPTPLASNTYQNWTNSGLWLFGLADTDAYGKEIDIHAKKLLLDTPDAESDDRQAANKGYADEVADAAKNLALDEVYNRNGDTRLDENKLILGPRWTLFETNENLQLWYSEQPIFEWVGGGYVVPRITSQVITAGTVALAVCARTSGVYAIDWSTNGMASWDRIATNGITQTVIDTKNVALVATNPSSDATSIYFRVASVVAPGTVAKNRSIAQATSGTNDAAFATELYVQDYVATHGGTGGTFVVTFGTGTNDAARGDWFASLSNSVLRTNGVVGTNTTGTVFANGQATAIGTNTPWTAMGYLTNVLSTGEALPYSYTGTNVVLSPTNYFLQKWALTSGCTAVMGDKTNINDWALFTAAVTPGTNTVNWITNSPPLANHTNPPAIGTTIYQFMSLPGTSNWTEKILQ